MAVAIQSPIQSLETDKAADSVAIDTARTTSNQDYWWKTSGRDLSRMLAEAKYPQEVRDNFLTCYRENICPLLGGKCESTSVKSGVGWDGNPLEYSFELKGTTKKQGVRFVVDLSPLRPADRSNPLSMETTQKVVDALAQRTPGFDESWSRSLQKWFVYSHLPVEEQHDLIAKSGQQTSVILGFDIHNKVIGPDRLPVLGKVYYPPCYAAAAKGLTRWGAVRQGINQLPDVSDNVLKSVAVIDDYLSDKPREWQQGTRYLATDLVAPGQARLKVYMRCFGRTFDEIWDYYTLGGRIPHLEEDKDKFRDLMDLVSGSTYDERIQGQGEMTEKRYTSATGKLTAIYFALWAGNSLPAPKLCIFPSTFAPNDEVIAKGLDAWFKKYEWADGGKTMEEQVQTCFTHRELSKKCGIFSFIGIGRKEDPAKKDLGIQVYVTPELYENPRF